MDAENIRRPSLRNFIHVVFKRKLRIFFIFALTVATVAIVSLKMPPIYQVAAQVLIKFGRESVYYGTTLATNGTPIPVVNSDQDERVNLAIQILKSQSLAEKVVDSLGPTTIYKEHDAPSVPFLRHFMESKEVPLSPRQRAVSNFQKDLEVEPVKRSSVINISLKHSDPLLAAKAVNTLVDFFIQQHARVHKNPEAPQLFQVYQDQSRTLNNKLRRAEERLERFKSQHNLTSLEEQRLLLLRNEAERRAALNQTLSQEAESESRLRQLGQQLASTPRIIPFEEDVDHNPYAVSNLQVRLVELELREHELMRKYTDQNPLLQGVRDEIRMVRQKLTDQEGKRYGRTRTGVNPTYQALEQEKLRTETELKAVKARKETQTAQLAEFKQRLASINAIEVELNRHQHEVEVDRQNYRLYLTKIEEARLSSAMDMQETPNASIIQAATPPLKPVSPKIVLNLILAGFIGIVGAFGMAFLSEYLDDRLERAEDVEDHLHLPILASIPKQKT